MVVILVKIKKQSNCLRISSYLFYRNVEAAQLWLARDQRHIPEFAMQKGKDRVQL